MESDVPFFFFSVRALVARLVVFSLGIVTVVIDSDGMNCCQRSAQDRKATGAQPGWILSRDVVVVGGSSRGGESHGGPPKALLCLFWVLQGVGERATRAHCE